MSAVKNIVITGLLFVSAMVCFGDNHYDKLFDQANSLYDEENYEEAKENYLQILDAGYASADLHYNVANVYYKLGSYPTAILHYEKCLKLQPGHEDARHNLTLTNQQIVDKIKRLPEVFYKRWWQSMRNSNSLDGWAWLIIVFLFAAMVSLFLFRILMKAQLKRLFFYLLLVFGAATVYCTIMSIGLYNHIHSEDEAIIFESTLNVQSAPTKSATTLYVIHSGLKVSVKERKDNWLNITLPDGNEGWVPANTIEPI